MNKLKIKLYALGKYFAIICVQKKIIYFLQKSYEETVEHQLKINVVRCVDVRCTF